MPLELPTVNLFVDWSAPFHLPPWQANDFISVVPGMTTVFDVLLNPDVIPAPQPLYKGSGDGLYVTSLGGVAEDPETGFWWVYLVNGEEPSVGCAAYVLHGGESIVWDFKHFSSRLGQAPHPGLAVGA
ncbi:MAG: DUF4430 domain-containing protein [Candidatus Eremiobacteraeota bacterium]|nr:DUF4430 domain-containing protein [Candidatus Eremiobacteraeota bacterium]